MLTFPYSIDILKCAVFENIHKPQVTPCVYPTVFGQVFILPVQFNRCAVQNCVCLVNVSWKGPSGAVLQWWRFTQYQYLPQIFQGWRCNTVLEWSKSSKFRTWMAFCKGTSHFLSKTLCFLSRQFCFNSILFFTFFQKSISIA